MVTLAIIGLGARGSEVYGSYLLANRDSVKVNAICDIDIEKINKYSKMYDVPSDMCFLNSDEFFDLGKVSDGVLICTDDKSHRKIALDALHVGYDMILEKPISVSEEECIEIRDFAVKKSKNIVVAHVLRYTEFFNQLKTLVDSGCIGDIVNINHTENIGYWHFAHSFVRGNWKNSKTSSPIVLAKCCHDLDILCWLIGKKCLRVTSFGGLNYFNKKNKPMGSSKHCLDCSLIDTCIYSAEKVYIKDRISGNNGWLANYLCTIPTDENIYKALRTGPYGICVFESENDVYDHQICNLLYDDGVTATLTLCAFTEDCYRKIHIMGTKGEILANDKDNIIKVNIFGNTSFEIDISKLAKDLSGHGGGDNKMLSEFIDFLKDDKIKLRSSIASSVQSHIIAFRCEESAHNDGKSIEV